MAFYDKFPYTNFQELNLDWLTQEVSKVRDNRDASDASAAAALSSEQAAAASAQASAESAAASAESATEAAGSASEAAASKDASADYLAQIGTHTAGAVADWLKENLTPTTPPIDATLTVSGAAADAKITGNKISDLNSDLNDEIALVRQDVSEVIDVTVGTNILNPDDIQSGKWVAASDGKATIVATENTADYGAAVINVEDIEKLTFSTNFSSLKIYNYFVTKFDGTIISTETPNALLPFTIDCAAGTRLYVSLRYYTNMSDSQWIMANIGASAMEYAPYSATDKLFGENSQIYIQKVVENTQKAQNLFNPANVQIGKWVQQSNGKAVITSNEYTDDYGTLVIDVKGILSVTFSTNFLNLKLYNYFLTDGNDNVLSTEAPNTAMPYTIKCGNAEKLFVSLNNYAYISNTQWVMLNEGSKVKDYVPYLDQNMIRKNIHVFSNDTEITVADKMLAALYTGNCDVFFEKGTYVLKDCYAYLIIKTGLENSCGLPVGNGCRYFFNGSTIISNEPDDHFNNYRNVLDSQWMGSDYEIYDCILVNNGGLYCVHDEGANSAKPYNHKYVNVKMQSASSVSGSKPFGCGTGFNTSLSFDGCSFIRNDEVDVCIAIHGPTTNPDNKPSVLDLNMKNCYVNVHNIALNTFQANRDTLNFFLFGNKFKTAFSNSIVNLIENNNTIIS